MGNLFQDMFYSLVLFFSVCFLLVNYVVPSSRVIRRDARNYWKCICIYELPYSTAYPYLGIFRIRLFLIYGTFGISYMAYGSNLKEIKILISDSRTQINIS